MLRNGPDLFFFFFRRRGLNGFRIQQSDPKNGKNEETEGFADSSSQTQEEDEEERKTSGEPLDSSSAEAGRKSSNGSKSAEPDASATTLNLQKLNKFDGLPFAADCPEFGKQSIAPSSARLLSSVLMVASSAGAPGNKRKVGIFRMCCWGPRDADSVHDNYYTDEYIRDNRSEKVDESEHVVGDFRR